MLIYNIYVCTHNHTMRSTAASFRTSSHKLINIYMYMCVYVYTNTHTYTCIYLYIICMYVHIISPCVVPQPHRELPTTNVYIYIYTCVYVYTNTHTYIHMYILIHNIYVCTYHLTMRSTAASFRASSHELSSSASFVRQHRCRFCIGPRDVERMVAQFHIKKIVSSLPNLLLKK